MARNSVEGTGLGVPAGPERPDLLEVVPMTVPQRQAYSLLGSDEGA